MTYTKPSNVTFTQMAIYIDEHVYSDNRDDDTIYKYLYHLSYMLAVQSGYYSKAEDYDSFSLFSATRLFLRLTNKKQFELDPDGNPKMNRVKSVLNYLKKVIYPYKVDFELEFNTENKDIEVIQVGSFDLGSHMIDEANIFDRMNFSFTLGNISSIVKSHLKKIPYKKHSSEWMNIYISCMLTLLDSITLSNSQLKEFKKLKFPKYESLNRLYNDLRYNDPILYHLDKSMSNYIRILVNELRHVISSEISWKSESHISADATMKGLICTSLDLGD